MSDAIAFLSRAIAQGQGLDAADLVLKGGRIFDLVSGDLLAGDVAITNDRIVGALGDYRGVREIDVRGKIVVPGFIDTHCHVECSLITPLEFDRCVLAPRRDDRRSATRTRSPTCWAWRGIRYFLDAAMATAMDLRVQLSSCVPSTDLETSGARLEVGDLLPLADHPKVLGLAEFMNYPGPARARSRHASPSSPPSRPGRSTATARCSAASPSTAISAPASAPTTR